MLYLTLNSNNRLSVCTEQEAMLTYPSEVEFTEAGLSWLTQYTWDGTTLQEIVPPPPPPPTLQELKNEKFIVLQQAYDDILNIGYQQRFRALEKNQGEYARLLQTVELAVKLGQATNETPIEWFDKTGVVETGTIAEYSAFCLGYSMWVKTQVERFYILQLQINNAPDATTLQAIALTFPQPE